MRFADYLKNVRAAYAAHGRDLKLKAPAPREALELVGSSLGISLPEELLEMWKTGNGARESPMFLRPGHLTAYSLMSTEESLEHIGYLKARAHQYGEYRGPEPRAAQLSSKWYEQGWIPFAQSQGLLLMLDYSPSNEGTRGQVISYTHDPDEIAFHAPTFGEFLDLNAAELENWIEEALLYG